MKRLINVEAIGFGEQDITVSDVSFEVTNNSIIMDITNEEKFLHDPEAEVKGMYTTFSENEVSWIQFTAQEEVFSQLDGQTGLTKFGAGVYINYLETRNEYRKTKATWLLLDEFNEKVIQPYIDKYGENEVCLSADFANDQLGRVIKKYVTQKMGIYWANKGIVWDDESYVDEDYFNSLSNEDEDEDSVISDLYDNGFKIFEQYALIPENKTLQDMETIFNQHDKDFDDSKLGIDGNGEIYLKSSLFDDFGFSLDLKLILNNNTEFVTIDPYVWDNDTIKGLKEVWDTNPNLYHNSVQRALDLYNNQKISIDKNDQITTLEQLEQAISSYGIQQSAKNKIKRLITRG